LKIDPGITQARADWSVLTGDLLRRVRAERVRKELLLKVQSQPQQNLDARISQTQTVDKGDLFFFLLLAKCNNRRTSSCCPTFRPANSRFPLWIPAPRNDLKAPQGKSLLEPTRHTPVRIQKRRVQMAEAPEYSTCRSLIDPEHFLLCNTCRGCLWTYDFETEPSARPARSIWCDVTYRTD
jgi:hypothetical protein